MSKMWARVFPRVLSVGVAVLAIEWGTGQAQAQMGFGMGMGPGMYGIGGFGFNNVPSPTDFLNQHALTNAARAGRPASNNVYANNPNSFVNRVRDNGFVPHSTVQARRSSSPRRSSGGSQGSTSANPAPIQVAEATPAAPSRGPAPPLASFVDAQGKLVWPGEAPTDGDLGVKRTISDEATLQVLDLLNKHGSAPITTVTTARQKLVDYGRPALWEVKTHSTPRIAESFNQFLLSLYDSLAAAANPSGLASSAQPAR